MHRIKQINKSNLSRSYEQSFQHHNCQTKCQTRAKIISLRKLDCIQASQDLMFISCLHGKSMQTRPGFRHSIKSRENHLSFAVVRRENSHHFLDRLMKQGYGEHETKFWVGFQGGFIHCDSAIAHLIRCRLLVRRREIFETEIHLIRCRLLVRRGKIGGREFHLIRCRLLVRRGKIAGREFHLIRCRLLVRRGKSQDENST